MDAQTLTLTDATVRFDGVAAVSGVDLTIERRTVKGLIGPNGAGKTTAVNALTGFVKLTSGSIALGDRDITSWSPLRRARHGMARTYQGARLFPHLNVFENVEVGALAVGVRRREARRRAWDLLEVMHLQDRCLDPADGLSHGDERRVGILRALAGAPRFLLLDEPAAGLNEAESKALCDLVIEIQHTFDVGILLIDHDIRFVMKACSEIQVLDHGQTIAVGSPQAIRGDAGVREAYLGSSAADEPESGAA